MKSYTKAAVCGALFALAGLCTAQAEEPMATAAPVSLLGTNPPHAPRGATIPYRAQATLAPSDQQAMPALGASADAMPSAQDEKPPEGMRITYKRARNGSFVKTYVAETGTN